jgi:hypothetical protein
MKTRNGLRFEGPGNKRTGLGREGVTVIDSYKQIEVPWKSELKIGFLKQRPPRTSCILSKFSSKFEDLMSYRGKLALCLTNSTLRHERVWGGVFFTSALSDGNKLQIYQTNFYAY